MHKQMSDALEDVVEAVIDHTNCSGICKEEGTLIEFGKRKRTFNQENRKLHRCFSRPSDQFSWNIHHIPIKKKVIIWNTKSRSRNKRSAKRDCSSLKKKHNSVQAIIKKK